MRTKTVTISTEYINLDALLKLGSLVSSGGEAKLRIQGGEVTLNGETCTMRHKKIRPGDVVALGDWTLRVAAE